MNPENHPTPRDRFQARWGVIAAVLSALVAGGLAHFQSRDVTDAKLIEMRDALEGQRSKEAELERQLRELKGNNKTLSVKSRR